MKSFDEFCRSRCLFMLSYVAMSFRQRSFVAVNYGQDEFCRRSAENNQQPLAPHSVNTWEII